MRYWLICWAVGTDNSDSVNVQAVNAQAAIAACLAKFPNVDICHVEETDKAGNPLT